MTDNPQTLGDYKKIAKTLWGEDSNAVTFLNEKIDESPNGKEEKVIAHESQMLFLLNSLHNQDHE